MDHIQNERISIQVSLSGYSFKIDNGNTVTSSGWMAPGSIFTTPQLQKRYDVVSVSFLTPKVALVPDRFHDPAREREILSETVSLLPSDIVESVSVPYFEAVLLYSLSGSDRFPEAVSRTVLPLDGEPAGVLPEMYFILKELETCPEYNKIVFSWADGFLHLAVAQGSNLLLANVFAAADFTTAEYYIFTVLKSLQLNPEISVICTRTPLDSVNEMSLYRYFKGVERL